MATAIDSYGELQQQLKPRRFVAPPLVYAPHPVRVVAYATPGYTLTAIQVPLPVVPASYTSWSGSSSPASYSAHTVGDTSGTAQRLNQNNLRNEIAHRLGAAGYCILQGLALQDGENLSVDVTPGVAAINGPVQLVATNLALSDGVRNHVWLLSDGQLTAVATSITAPDDDCVYLGSVLTSAGIITGIDHAGRVENFKGHLWRRTADTAVPTDVPSSDIRFFNETAAGLWFWDGTQYVSVDAATYLSVSVAGASDVALTAAQARNGILKFTGTLTGNINVTPPAAVPGQKWVVINGTSGSYTLTFKTISGTGIAVTQGTASSLFCDGTNIATAAAFSAVAADPDDAMPDSTATYTQSNFDTLVSELHDLKAKMRTSGILLT